MVQINIFRQDKKLPLLCDLVDKEVFLHKGMLYVRHEANGPSHYRCYCISNLCWSSVGKGVPVERVCLTIDARLQG